MSLHNPCHLIIGCQENEPAFSAQARWMASIPMIPVFFYRIRPQQQVLVNPEPFQDSGDTVP
jgi:hypothetical protein